LSPGLLTATWYCPEEEISIDVQDLDTSTGEVVTWVKVPCIKSSVDNPWNGPYVSLIGPTTPTGPV
jgi:hypothetical protein